MTFILTLQEVALSPLPVGRVRQQQHQRALSEPGRGRGRRAGKQDKENVETGPESTDTEQDRAPNIKHSDNQQIELNSSGSIMLKFVYILHEIKAMNISIINPYVKPFSH